MEGLCITIERLVHLELGECYCLPPALHVRPSRWTPLSDPLRELPQARTGKDEQMCGDEQARARTNAHVLPNRSTPFLGIANRPHSNGVGHQAESLIDRG